MSAAKDDILGRIRKALRDVPPDETPADVAVPHAYRRNAPAPLRELVAQFIERVAEYRAVIHRISPSGLPGAIASALAGQGVKRLVIPAGLPEDWMPPGITLLRDPGLSNDQLDRSDGVLTVCALGIAQTGTIVLDGGPGQGRRAITLLPDYHLCIIRDEQVVGTVPEAVAALEAVARVPGRPITWISGPSATSDIELNRVEGVHGPRRMEVLVVADDLD